MLIRLLRVYLAPHRRSLGFVVGLQALQTVATLFLPSLNADIIDQGIVAGDTAYIWRLGLIMVVLTLVQVGAGAGALFFGARVAMAVGRDVRAALFDHVTELSTGDVTNLGAPSLITRVTNDISQIQVFVLMTCTMLLVAPLSAAVGIVLALREDAVLSSILVVSIPLLLGIVVTMISVMRPHFAVMQERIDAVNRVLREQIVGIRVVRAFGREPLERQRFDRVNHDVTATALATGRIMAFTFPLVLAVVNVSSVAVLALGGVRVDREAMTVGSLVAFLTYLTIILQSVMMATFIAALAPRATVCAERILEVLDTTPSIPMRTAATDETFGPITTLELRGVTHRHPGADRPVLDNLSFTVHAGETLAVVGGTGSGKSTLIGAIARLFDATDGQILFNGVPGTVPTPDAFWANLGLAPQRPFLFSGTVRSNLLFADPDADDARLWAALGIAQAEAFVRAMPEGLDSPITQGGTNVSGGQRQRLAIARTLVKPRSLYLFDDSFSALDVSTEARLRQALGPATADAITLVVAQRVSSVIAADRILVLDGGRMVGLGPHHELLRTCPTYAEIVASQDGIGLAA